MEYKVRLYDTDSGGSVFFGNYFQMFSMLKDEFLESLFKSNFNSYLKERGLFLPTTEASAKFLKGAKYGDTVRLTISAEVVNPKVLRFHYRVQNPANAELIYTEGQTVSIMANLETGKSTQIPEDVMKVFQEVSVP
jgi:YbgC/YbaW family acyl-CoA thioester hydrolase